MATSPTSGPGGSSGLTGASLVVQGTATQTDPLADIRSNDGTPALDIESDGTGGVFSIDMLTNSGNLSFGSGDMTLSAPDILRLASGYLKIEGSAEIADADLAVLNWSLWLDGTPAATKLMIKAKDSAGTVRTAAIALS